ncbi:MAG: VCBS repeat-containing protein [Chitinivibrionales bacterium]|nr:VCBS repeat-containing protein [Chitinivibrionales bacterium]
MRFEKITIDEHTPGTENDVCLVADVNGDGYNDIIIGGKRGEGNVVWYEYPDWTRHTIGTAHLEAGGAVLDITGNGLPDLIAGNPYELNDGKELYWFENSGDPDKPWTRYTILEGYRKYHDQAVGDIDNDGAPEIIFASQGGRVVGYFDIPDNPRVSPWPEHCRHIIGEDIEVEGLVVCDIDGDGRNELVAGPNIFKYDGATWQRTCIDESYRMTRVAVGDIDGDGKPEIVLSEGESNPGRLAWVSAWPKLEMHVLADDLFHPHSLELADMTGDGTLDIFVAEMGLGKNPSPKVIIYRNGGNATFEPTIVDGNYATHDSRVGDFGRSGRMSIVGKPYAPQNHVHLWLNV